MLERDGLWSYAPLEHGGQPFEIQASPREGTTPEEGDFWRRNTLAAEEECLCLEEGIWVALPISLHQDDGCL